MTMKAVSTVPSGIDAGVGLVVALYCSGILLPLVIFDSAALLAKVTVEERRNKHSDVPLMSTTIDTIKQYASLAAKRGLVSSMGRDFFNNLNRPTKTAS